MVPPNGKLRVVETAVTLANEYYYGDNFCHNEYQGGWVALCEGATCLATPCTSYLDYMESTDTAGRPPVHPTCATFTPSPISVGSLTSTQSVSRVAFAGSGAAGVTSDWGIRTYTRD